MNRLVCFYFILGIFIVLNILNSRDDPNRTCFVLKCTTEDWTMWVRLWRDKTEWHHPLQIICLNILMIRNFLETIIADIVRILGQPEGHSIWNGSSKSQLVFHRRIYEAHILQRKYRVQWVLLRWKVQAAFSGNSNEPTKTLGWCLSRLSHHVMQLFRQLIGHCAQNRFRSELHPSASLMLHQILVVTVWSSSCQVI